MGVSKKKKVIQTAFPSGKHVEQPETPSSYYNDFPAWNFNTCDEQAWAFTESNVGTIFWSEILPFLKRLESQSWGEILISAKKKNHHILVNDLSLSAQKRLAELYIEQEAILSLRLTGTHRLYGYITDRVFNILWFDKEHGDNKCCVCRSHKKHT